MRAPPATNGPRPSRRARFVLAVLCAALITSGCATGHPQPLTQQELAEAETFPYFRVYWVGRSFAGQPLSAAAGRKGYISRFGDSVYYGDCVHGKGIFGGGSCQLPLQVTTVIYSLHSNSSLGPQNNIVVRGVPATVYDEGRSIEIYTGRVAIDIFSDTFAHAIAATSELVPLNAAGPSTGNLPPPVYCPGLSGAMDGQVQRVMNSLPRHACQRDAAAVAFAKSLS